MATNTYVELDRAVLVSNTGPVTFTNIPQTYTDLRIVIKGGFVDSGFMIGARVGNGSVDAGANYSYQLFRASSSGVESSYRKSGMVFGAFCQQGGNNLHNVITVDFLNYSNTTTFKSWSSRYSNPTEGIDAAVSLWRSTSAINTISIAECGDGGSGSFNYGNMLSGTTISLYGIRAENVSPAPKATGGTIYSDSTYYYHVFGSTAAFTPLQSLSADILVVAGGGGGGAGRSGSHYAGGGGAGGLRTYLSQSLSTTSYTCTVGGGGTGGPSQSFTSGTNGGNSSFAGLTGTSGGGGGGSANANGLSGGSGGGGGGYNSGSPTGGAGTSGEGNAGGNMGGAYQSGGGGGAGAVGANGSTNNAGGGNGGIGATSSFITSIVNATGAGQLSSSTGYFAGGGGGSPANGTTNGNGGLGGGGNASDHSTATQSGRVGTGGGGGGGAAALGLAGVGGNGGSGSVIIRYAKA